MLFSLISSMTAPTSLGRRAGYRPRAAWGKALTLRFAIEHLGGEGVVRAVPVALPGQAGSDRHALGQIARDDLGHAAVGQPDAHLHGPDKAVLLHPDDGAVVLFLVRPGFRLVTLGRRFAAPHHRAGKFLTG